MSRGSRALVALVTAGLLPLVIFAGVLAFGGQLGLELGLGTLLTTVALLAGLAAALLAPAVAAWVSEEALIAPDASSEGVTDGAPVPAHQAALAERNRQVEELARRVQLTPIGAQLTEVVGHVVATAQFVTGDRTWTLAVLESAMPGIPAGWYGATDAERGELEDLHRWASVAAAQSDNRGRSHHAEGPWGAFLAIEVQSDDTLRAILLAPWEGRRLPTSAEHSMLTLIGQHAAVALEHAVLYERLQEQTRQLDRLTGIQGDFLRGVTHDLQSPLTSIGGLAAELRESGRLTGAAKDDLESIVHQAGRLRRMVAQLLTVTGLEAGAIVPRDEVFRLEPIVRRVWTSVRSDRPFSLEVKGPARLVTGDPDRIEQVIWALLDNAMKYSPDASPIFVELNAVDLPDGTMREELRIRDVGIGMDDETQHRAMERFYRSPKARTVAPDGSGIGLFTTHGLVELMGGELEIESAPGAGTTMVVRLPAEPADASAEIEAAGTNVRPPA